MISNPTTHSNENKSNSNYEKLAKCLIRLKCKKS